MNTFHILLNNLKDSITRSKFPIELTVSIETLTVRELKYKGLRYINGDVPTTIFGEGREPNVRLAKRVVKRKSNPCIDVKRKREYLSLSYEMPYLSNFLFSHKLPKQKCYELKWN